MNLLEQFVRTQSAQALGWALAHSIWQGAAAAAIVGLALWTTRSARTRYAVACGAMLLLLVSFAVTIIGAAQGPEPIAMQTELRRLMPARAGNAWQPVVAPETAAAFVPWLAPIWAAGDSRG